MLQIWDISQRPGSSALDNSVLISRIMHEHSKSLPFDAAWLVDGLQEEVAGEFSVRHVSPMVIIPSRISITSARIYLQPLVNLSSAPVFKFKISSISRTLNRRHMHEESALEIFFEPSVDARIFSSQVSARAFVMIRAAYSRQFSPLAGCSGCIRLLQPPQHASNF